MASVEHLGQYDPGISYKKVFFWFILAAIIISLAAIYFVLSRVTIKLIPKTQTKELNLEVTLLSQVNAMNFDENIMRGVLISAENKLSKDFSNIAPKKIEENATGQVTIHNGYTRAQGFKEGDVLLTKGGNPPQKIALKENVIVYRDQTKTVNAYALEKGIIGQIPPSQFIFEKYDDFMNEKVTVESKEPFKNGARTAIMVTENDIEIAKNEVIKEITVKNFEDLQGKVREGEELSDQNSVSSVENFYTNITPPIETDNFKLDLVVKTTAVVFKKEDLVTLVNTKLKNMTESNQEFLRYDPKSFQYKLEQISTTDQKAILKIKINGEFRSKLSSKIFDKNEIKGYNEKALKAHYRNFEDIENIEVTFWPSFRKTVPDMNNRIIIEIQS